MSKRKPMTRVDKILPNDTQIGQRNSAWRALMNKYSKCEEKSAIQLKDYLDAAEPSEGSDENNDDSDSGSDIVTDDEADSDVENREDIKNQLRQVVDQRKPVWKKTGLQQQMAEIELPSFDGGNLPSRKKVEDWLFNRPFGAGGVGATRRMSQHEEIIMSEEQNEDGKQTKIKQHMQFLSMTAGSGGGGDDDSLQSVDTASYILASRKQCSGTNRVTIIKKFTKTVEFKAMPPLDENSPLPVASKPNSPPPVSHASRKACKSDSTLEKKDSKSKSSSRRRNASDSPRKTEKPSKTQKKTFKKKAAPSSRKKQSDKPPKENVADQYEEALKNGAKAKKVTRVYRPAPKRNEWRESDKSSSGEDNDEVFMKPKPEPKTPPRKKPSPRKIRFASPSSSTLSIVGSFEAINLVTPEKKKIQPQTSTESQDKPFPVDQTTNMTALFSDANEKIINSTEIGAASTTLQSVASAGNQSRTNSTRSSNRSERFPGYPEDKAIVVYKPREISEHNRKVRIYGHQMDLSKVTRACHLRKFQTFSCVIHTNSSIVFYPSDSEDELPDNSRASDSDSDDPLTSYRKQDAPLRVVERGYTKGREAR